MRKITNSLGESFKPVTLYLDDLEQIIEILREVSDKVEISTSDYALDDLKQLVKMKCESLNKLSIGIPDPYVSLDLESDSIRLYISKNEPLSRGLFEKIKEILIHRKRPFGWLLYNWYLAGIFAGIGIPLFIVGIEKGNWSYITLSVIPFSGLGALWTWYGFRNQSKRYSIIIPKYRNQAPSFFKRNSDAIVLVIISAVIGGIITLAIAKFAGAIP